MVMRCGFLLCAAAVAPWTSLDAGAQAIDLKYERRETREASRAATLAHYMPQLEWSPWHLIGPFDNADFSKHDIVYPPELEFRLDQACQGKDGRTVRWRAIEHADWQMIDLSAFEETSKQGDAIAYLHRFVDSSVDADFPVEMGSDDGLKVWCNRRLIVSADTPRGLNPQDHRVNLPIRKGRNELLVKVTQGAGDWQFQMQPRMDPRIAAMLEYSLNQDFPTSPEAAHYRILTVLEPEGVALEVGGLCTMPDGRPVVATRRGDVWIVDGAYADPPFGAKFQRFASGLHEPLGAQWRDGGLWVVQRGELTKLVDDDGDGRADRFQTVCDDWGVSGNYHEFAFGPEFDARGRAWVTLNVGFCGSLGKSTVPWRGWAVVMDQDGTLTPVCGGLRSPNGIGMNAEGEVFFTDNQGDWVGTNKLSHLAPGDWHGHPSSSHWYETAGIPKPAGEKDFKQPAVWFPYDKMGRSASDIVLDDTAGKFGPFDGQLFVGDQYSAEVMRVCLEKVNGAYQGACFPFLRGLDCGVNRLCFAPDGSMLAGETNRGWWSEGSRPWGLQRIVYTGRMPFEVLRMRALPDGFELTFTESIDARTASASSSYRLSSYAYERFEKYGSPEVGTRDHAITSIMVADDARSVRLTVEGCRPRHVHELHLDGVRSADGDPLLHPVAYYTLNAIPAN